jgi:hypothetical protein
MTKPIENPFANGGMFTRGQLVDDDTVRPLQVLHTLTGQLAAAVAEAHSGRDRVDNLFALLDGLAEGTTGDVGARGDMWDAVVSTYRWDLTRLYGQTALDYAWAASRIAGTLATGRPLTPLAQWADNERHPGADWLTADPERRVYPVQVPPPPAGLGPRHGDEVAALNEMLADTHRRMLDTVIHVLKVHPDDLRGDPAEPPRLEPEDWAAYDPRCARLEAAGSALYTYASACRAVVLLDVVAAPGGTGE